MEFLARVRGEPIRRQALDSIGPIAIHAGWRQQLQRVLDPVGDAVLRLHYGDGVSLPDVEKSAAIDLASLDASRSAIRDAVRDMLRRQHDGTSTWSDARVDDVIGRIANAPQPGCPPPLAILSDKHREHADVCPDGAAPCV